MANGNTIKGCSDSITSYMESLSYAAENYLSGMSQWWNSQPKRENYPTYKEFGNDVYPWDSKTQTIDQWCYDSCAKTPGLTGDRTDFIALSGWLCKCKFNEQWYQNQTKKWELTRPEDTTSSLKSVLCAQCRQYAPNTIIGNDKGQFINVTQTSLAKCIFDMENAPAPSPSPSPSPSTTPPSAAKTSGWTFLSNKLSWVGIVSVDALLFLLLMVVLIIL